MFKLKLFKSIGGFAAVTVSIFLMSSLSAPFSKAQSTVPTSAEKELLSKNDLETEFGKIEEQSKEKKKKAEDEAAKPNYPSEVSVKTFDANEIYQTTDGATIALGGTGLGICWSNVEVTAAPLPEAKSGNDKTLPPASKEDLKKSVDIIAGVYVFHGSEHVRTLDDCLKKFASYEKVDLSTLPKLSFSVPPDHSTFISGVKTGNKAIAPKNFCKSDDYVTLENALTVQIEKPNCKECWLGAKSSVERVEGKTASAMLESIIAGLTKFKDKEFEGWKATVATHLANLDKATHAADIDAVLTSLKGDGKNLEELGLSPDKTTEGRKLLHESIKTALTKPEKLVRTPGEAANSSDYADVYSRGLSMMADESAAHGSIAESSDHKRDLEMKALYEPGQEGRIKFIAAHDLNNKEIGTAMSDAQKKWDDLQIEARVNCPNPNDPNRSTECVKTQEKASAFYNWMGPIYAQIKESKAMFAKAYPNTPGAREILADYANDPTFKYPSNYALRPSADAANFGASWNQQPVYNNNQFSQNGPLYQTALPSPVYNSQNYPGNFQGVPPSTFQQMNYSSGNWGNPTYVPTPGTNWNSPGTFSGGRG